MTTLIAGVGILIAAFGMAVVVSPGLIRGWMDYWNTPVLLYTAIGIRVVLGVLFVAFAPGTNWPAVIEVLGWVMIAAAAVGLAMGPQRLQSFVRWAAAQNAAVQRGWGVLAVGLGAMVALAA